MPEVGDLTPSEHDVVITERSSVIHDNETKFCYIRKKIYDVGRAQ